MIEPDEKIHFTPDDVPSTLLPPHSQKKEKKRKPRDIPEPKGWRPIGYEW